MVSPRRSPASGQPQARRKRRKKGWPNRNGRQPGTYGGVGAGHVETLSWVCPARVGLGSVGQRVHLDGGKAGPFGDVVGVYAPIVHTSAGHIDPGDVDFPLALRQALGAELVPAPCLRSVGHRRGKVRKGRIGASSGGIIADDVCTTAGTEGGFRGLIPIMTSVASLKDDIATVTCTSSRMWIVTASCSDGAIEAR
jgi:hypothetical protein